MHRRRSRNSRVTTLFPVPDEVKAQVARAFPGPSPQAQARRAAALRLASLLAQSHNLGRLHGDYCSFLRALPLGGSASLPQLEAVLDAAPPARLPCPCRPDRPQGARKH